MDLRQPDPRIWQIVTLSSLLSYGVLVLGFPVGVEALAWVLGSAVGTQWIAAKARLTARFDPKSAAITALSLAILLRVTEPWLLGGAAAFAVASKLALRVGGKHVWNPSALAIAAAVVGTGQAWLSPGQWGAAAWFAFLVASLGGLVVFRAERSDVTWAFGAFWCALVLGRSLWLGEPTALPIHRLQDGGLLLFTFFMISDPKTTPDSRAGRIAFAGVVALVAFGLKFVGQIHAGLVFALVLSAPLVPILDRWLPGRRYAWPRPPSLDARLAAQGAFHAPDHAIRRTARRRNDMARA
jgi:Na+-translocating ferredoxin:NAD+ oxidoreductase RnfD subunit